MTPLLGIPVRPVREDEIWTPPKIVEDMLDLLPESVWIENKTFLDPAAGIGNILVGILKRKLKFGHEPLEALKSIYGVEIMEDNCEECRKRLLKECGFVDSEMERVVQQQIVCADALTYDYEFEG